MPFFSFLRCNKEPSGGCQQGRGEGQVGSSVAPSTCASVVSIKTGQFSSVAECSEKSFASSRAPPFGFFGGATQSSSAGSEDSVATDKHEKLPDNAMAKENEQTAETQKKTQLTQPIPFEHFSREWMNISGQDTFDGFRLEGAKQVNKYLQTCHSFCLGTQLRDSGYSYQFGPTVAISAPADPSLGENAPPPSPHFFAMAKLGTDGSLQGRLIKTLCQSADVKLNFNSSLKDEQRNFYEISLDNTGKDWASSLKLAWQLPCISEDAHFLMNGLSRTVKGNKLSFHCSTTASCWILDGMFSQVLTPKLQAGCELTYVSANGASMLAVGGRYNLDKHSVVSCQLSQQPDFKAPTGLTKLTHTCKVQYSRKVTDRLSIATECEYSHPDTDSALRVGWEYLFRQARVQGLVDSCGRISVFAQDYNGFGVSGLIDYWRGTYKFGFLMHVVPPPEAPQPQSH